MRAEAAAPLARLSDEARVLAHRPLTDERLRWLEHRPGRVRESASPTSTRPRARRHTGCRPPRCARPGAQAVAIVALDEVLDRQEGWRRGRHSNAHLADAHGS